MKQPLVKTKDGDFELLFQVTEEELQVATLLRDFHSQFEANPRGFRLESEVKSENELDFRWGATRSRRRMSLPSSTVPPPTPTPTPPLALLVPSSKYEATSPSSPLNFCTDVGCERCRRLKGKACEEKLSCEIGSANTTPKPSDGPSFILKIHPPNPILGGQVQSGFVYHQRPTTISVTSPVTQECSRTRGGRELDKSDERVGPSGLPDLNKSPADTDRNLTDSIAIQPFDKKNYDRLQTAQARQKRMQQIRMKRMFNNKLHSLSR